MALYQITLHKFAYCETAGQTGDKARHFMSHYSYAPPFEPETQNFNHVASWLVFAERMLSGNSMQFGRVVFLRIDGEGHDTETPTVTCVPENGDVGNYGLRVGSMLDAFCSVAVVRNTATGRKYKREFFGCLGMDDLDTKRRSFGHKEHFRLNPDGPFAWLLGWWRHIIQTLEFVDPSRQYDVLGRKVDYEPYTSQHIISSATDHRRMRQAWRNASDKVYEYHDFLLNNDISICGELAKYQYDYNASFRPFYYSTLGPIQIVPFLRAQYSHNHWTRYAEMLKPIVPADAVLIPNVPFVFGTTGQIRVHSHIELVMDCLSRLYQIHQYYCKHTGLTNFPIDGGPPSLPVEAADLHTDSVRPYGAYIHYKGQWRLFINDGRFYIDKHADAAWLEPGLIFLHYGPHMDFARFLHSIHDEVVGTAFHQIDLCNVLDQVIAPVAEQRADGRRSIKLPEILPPEKIINTFPREFEMTPYLAIQPYKKPEVRDISEKYVSSAEAWIRTPSAPRVPKRADGLPVWWKGIPPKPDYKGALDALGKFGEDKYQDVDDAWKDLKDWNVGGAIDKITDQHLNK